jgi:hypothetical protein
MARPTATLPALLALALLGACDPSGDGPEGLGLTRREGGPVVVWDVEHRPLPEIPLPNDQATRLDPTSPTGRRVNVSLSAVTRYESRIRARFNRLDGFGAFAPITVRFDQPLDLENLAARQRDNDDFRDDAVYLLNVDPKCKRFGEEVALDFGRGRYPVTLFGHATRTPDPKAPFGFTVDEGPNKLFPLDPRAESHNLLFPDWTEDVNDNGTLDPGEDLDDDGALEEANFIDPHACDGVRPSTPEHERCVADHLLDWYERSTHTLILRPVWPLEERCTYAAVLTRRLYGENRRSVESPFPAVQAADQVDALAPVADLLPRYGLSRRDVAFAWSFTVGTMTRDVELVRAGLYGDGPLARLAADVPVSTFDVWTRNEWRTRIGAAPLESGGDDRLLAGGCATAAFTAYAGTTDGAKQICGGYADLAAVGGIFAGTFEAPNFLVNKAGEATDKHPADDDEVFDLDAESGHAVYGKTEVTFFCVLPRGDAAPPGLDCEPSNSEGTPWCKPYPVTFFAHGYGSAKGEFLQYAGRSAQMGVAACALDSFGHGRNIFLTPKCDGFAELKLLQTQLGHYGMPELAAMVAAGRDRDLDNDGCPDPGADQWTANLFHTRDVVRQSVLEEMVFVRDLHAMDGTQRDGRGGVLGDVDGDGRPDIGGPHNTVGAWGISLGGQLTGVLAGAEPAIDAVVPNAVGGGLTDIALRLGEGGLAEAVMLPVQGPMLVACLPTDEHQRPLASGETPGPCLPGVGAGDAASGPQKAGELLVGWYAHNLATFTTVPVARLEGAAAGDRLVVENLDKGISTTARIGPRGFARASIAADALSPAEQRKALRRSDDDDAPKRALDPTALGDRIRVHLLDSATGEEKAVVDTWQWDAPFQGTIYPAGATLVALQEGLGYARNTPDFRRFYGIAQHAVAPADPAVWSRRYFAEPIEAPYDPAYWPGRSHVMVMPTIGDPEVPAATGCTLGRTAGLFGSWNRDPGHFGPEHGWRELFTPDPRYGTSIEQWLLDQHVVEGDYVMQRFADDGPNPNVLFDPDDVSDGAASFTCLHAADWSAANGEFRCPADLDDTDATFGVPHPAPGNELRRDAPRGDGTFDSFRIPLLRPAGQHGIFNPQPFRAFDADAFMGSFTARYLASRAREVRHEPGCDCTYVTRPAFVVGGETAWPGVPGEGCPEGDPAYGKPCSEACAAAWGFRQLPPAVCKP